MHSVIGIFYWKLCREMLESELIKFAEMVGKSMDFKDLGVVGADCVGMKLCGNYGKNVLKIAVR